MTGRRWRGTAAASAVLFVAGFVLGACGGDDGEPADPPPAGAIPVDEWVAGFCGSFDTYVERVGGVADELQAEVDAEPDVAKAALEDVFTEAVAATDALVVDLEAAGVPSVGDGEQIARGLVELFELIADAYREALTDTQALNTDDADEFEADRQELAAELDDAQAGLEDPFGSVDSPDELNDAADAEPACDLLEV